ncbi:hypothetical protein [Verrucomicrobium sp. BvORR034]|jgi:hypothetical protein|uniref:hypothetical protein n=1 Tax=Verrucomicrobium sp. BvORR034 TaxID=1396418 RepID=UPI000678F647|nr:hypothetical protein [Verrucomicrobium sp. BvORR034]
MKIIARSNSRPQLRLGRNLTLLLGLWICTAIPRYAAAEEIFLSSASKEKETVMWKVDTAVLAATPSWDGRGKTPFDQVSLLEKAVQTLAKHHPEVAPNAKLNGISVRRVSTTKKGVDLADKWYIQFTFIPDSGKLVYSHVVLLADGTVVEPEVKTR